MALRSRLCSPGSDYSLPDRQLDHLLTRPSHPRKTDTSVAIHGLPHRGTQGFHRPSVNVSMPGKDAEHRFDLSIQRRAYAIHPPQ